MRHSGGYAPNLNEARSNVGVQLGKAVPFVGGLVGGAVNAVGCRSIGKLADKAFPAVKAA